MRGTSPASTGASSSEFDPETPAPVIATMEEQKAFVEGAGDLGGTMRLGLYPASLAEGSIIAKAYGVTEVEERHRHRYEVNNSYRGRLEESGMVFSGLSPDHELVEFIELPPTCTRTSLRHRHIRSSSRVRTALTRCSPGSSRRLWTGSGASASSRSRRGTFADDYATAEPVSAHT